MFEAINTTTNSYFVHQDTVTQQSDFTIKKTPNNDAQNRNYDDQKKLNDYKVEESKSLFLESIENYNPKNLAETAYNTMFTNNKYLSCILETQNIKGTSIEKVHALSQLFIKDIQEELGELNEEEIQIIKKFQELPPFRFIHQTKHDLKTQGVLQIISRDRLKQNGMYKHKYKGLRTNGNDVTVCNSDFVFFSVEFNNYKITEPPTIYPHGDLYAPNAYIIPENFSDFGYITLTDHALGTINASHSPFHALDGCFQFIEKFKAANETKCTELIDMAKDPVTKTVAVMRSTKLKSSPIFSLKDIRLGMALYAIKRIRLCDKMIEEYRVELCEQYTEKFVDIILSQEADPPLPKQREIFINYILSKEPKVQNLVLNAIFNLEYHLPGMVVAQPGEYGSHEDW